MKGEELFPEIKIQPRNRNKYRIQTAAEYIDFQETDEWKTCHKFDTYIISNKGIIKRKKDLKLKRIQWHEKKQFSYAILYSRKLTDSLVTPIGHLMMRTFKPNIIPDHGYIIKYKDGNRRNNAIENLYYGPRPYKKIDDKMLKSIAIQYIAKERTIRQISRDMPSIAETTISKIVNGTLQPLKYEEIARKIFEDKKKYTHA